MQTVTANGAQLPVLGFGTYGMDRGDMLRMLPAALKAGFRHIDTAQMYGNEAEVGECVAQSGLARSEIFITTKVWVSNYPTGRFAASVDESLRKLRSDHIDLLLLHWPGSPVPLADQIGSLNTLVGAGKVRHIGVSNFNRTLMAEAVRLSDVPLVTNQVEYHPFLDQSAVLAGARGAGMAVTAYCPMAIGRVFDEPMLAEIAAHHRKSIAQIVLRWVIQQSGLVALSRTTNPVRLGENVAIFDFELTPSEMAEIHALARPGNRIVNPPGLSPHWDAIA
jgi:2,5-diketo-D-gluconate reductase B